MSLQGDNETNEWEDSITWEDYYMAVAVTAAKRSKDPRTRVGACIVNEEKRIISIGYNGMPNGCSDHPSRWEQKAKHFYVCHAEMNAIINCYTHVKNCTLYVNHFPCNECAKIIIQSGIKKVVYQADKKAEKDKYKKSRKMLTEVNVKLVKYKPKKPKIEINLEIHDDIQSPTQ